MGRIEDSGLTIQELVEDERLEAHIQRVAEEMACTWWDNLGHVLSQDMRE
jgi:hypothetical protein